MSRDLLLVIDMQKVYAAGGTWSCSGMEAAAAQIQALIDARADSLDVIFTRFLASDSPTGVWTEYNRVNRAVNEDPEANAMLALFSDALQKYPLYTKSVYSSLMIPEVMTAAMAADRVVVAGVVAECCVLATVMALIDAGIPVIYLTDGIAGETDATAAAVAGILAGLEPLHLKRRTVAEYLADTAAHSRD